MADNKEYHLKPSEKAVLIALSGRSKTKKELIRELRGSPASQTITEALPELQRLELIEMFLKDGEYYYRRVS